MIGIIQEDWISATFLFFLINFLNAIEPDNVTDGQELRKHSDAHYLWESLSSWKPEVWCIVKKVLNLIS